MTEVQKDKLRADLSPTLTYLIIKRFFCRRLMTFSKTLFLSQFIFILINLFLSLSSVVLAEVSSNISVVASAIRYETTLSNDSVVGKPLPLAAHWNTGWRIEGFSPKYQLNMIEKGHYILPTFHLPAPWDSDWIGRSGYYEKAIKKAAALNLPISFISTQWERSLTISKKFFSLPKKDNPNVVTNSNSILKKVSPFGPATLWYEAGLEWTTTPLVKKIQNWYPSPPLVFFVSNNEHDKLAWPDVETSLRYTKLHGSNHNDNFKREIVGDGWIERYRSLQDGMRNGLDHAEWANKAVFVAYDAMGPRAFGRWKDWLNYSLYTPGRIEPWPLAWDGVSASYYVNNWSDNSDYNVMSPQIEAMNWVFMRDEAMRLNPDFRMEISTWDGYEPTKDNDKRKQYAAEGQIYNADRYEGFIQFGMWLLRPRVVREFRNHLSKISRDEVYFLSVIKSVDRVHNNPTLKKFWRKGRLVVNKSHSHPYQTHIPTEYINVDRWFLLDTDLDPKRPWKLETEIPVFFIALVIGEEPNREWLVYGHSPLQRYSVVNINIPDYVPIKVHVKPEGTFFYVQENKTIQQIL